MSKGLTASGAVGPAGPKPFIYKGLGVVVTIPPRLESVISLKGAKEIYLGNVCDHDPFHTLYRTFPIIALGIFTEGPIPIATGIEIVGGEVLLHLIHTTLVDVSLQAFLMRSHSLEHILLNVLPSSVPIEFYVYVNHRSPCIAL